MPDGAEVGRATRLRIESLYPGVRPLAYRVLEDVARITTRAVGIAQAARTVEYQDALYASGRTIEGPIVTNARGGTSWHNYGLAFDIACVGSDPYLRKEAPHERDLLWTSYGRIVVAHGLEWGGNFKLVSGVRDLPHAQLHYGLGINEAFELYRNGGRSAVWAYLDRLRGVPVGEGWEVSSG